MIVIQINNRNNLPLPEHTNLVPSPWPHLLSYSNQAMYINTSGTSSTSVCAHTSVCALTTHDDYNQHLNERQSRTHVCSFLPRHHSHKEKGSGVKRKTAAQRTTAQRDGAFEELLLIDVLDKASHLTAFCA